MELGQRTMIVASVLWPKFEFYGSQIFLHDSAHELFGASMMAESQNDKTWLEYLCESANALAGNFNTIF